MDAVIAILRDYIRKLEIVSLIQLIKKKRNFHNRKKRKRGEDIGHLKNNYPIAVTINNLKETIKQPR